MLDQDTDETFNGAEYSSVNHNRTVFFAVFAYIAHVEFFRHLEVQLNGAALPGTADAVLQMEVDLRAVERAVALVDNVFEAELFKRLGTPVGDEEVRVGKHLHESFVADGILQVHGDGALVAVFDVEDDVFIGQIGASFCELGVTDAVTAGRLYLYDVGSLIGEETGGAGSRDEGRELDDLDSVEGSRSAHIFSPFSVELSKAVFAAEYYKRWYSTKVKTVFYQKWKKNRKNPKKMKKVTRTPGDTQKKAQI